MTELEALLAAARAEPDDDLPRLVLADWLQENGDPDRGEFIRLQVRNSGFPDYPCSRREEALLNLHGAEWLGPAMKKLRTIRGTHAAFERGLVQVEFSSAAFQDRTWLDEGVDRCFREGWVEQLDLREPVVLGWLAEWPHLAGVSGVRISAYGGRLDVSEVATFFRSPHLMSLRSLKISRNLHLDDLVRVLVYSPLLPRLKSLRLQGTLGREWFEALVGCRVSALTGVNFSFSGMGDEGLRALLESPLATGLTALELPHCNIGPGGAQALAGSPVFSRLRQLSLLGNPLTDTGVEALVRSPRPPSLESLDLSRCQITDAGLEALAGWSGLASIRKLMLSSANEIGDAAVRKLAASTHLAGLQGLWLTGDRITDDGVAALAATPHLASLRWLVLGVGGDAAARALAASPYLERLEYLNVPSLDIGPAARRELIESPRLGRLEYLGLADPEDDRPVERAVWRERLTLDLKWKELSEAITDSSAAVRLGAVRGLGEVLQAGPASDQLNSVTRKAILGALDSDADAGVRVAAAGILKADLDRRLADQRSEGFEALAEALRQGASAAFPGMVDRPRRRGRGREPAVEESYCPVTRQCLDHDDSGVREAAWELFELLHSPPGDDLGLAKHGLRAVVGSVRHADIRARAADALGDLLYRIAKPDPGTIECVRNLLDGETDVEVRQELLACLPAGVSYIGEWEWCPDLTELMDSPHAEVRATVVDLLGDLGQAGDPGVGQVLERALSDPDDDVRLAAVAALGRCARDRRVQSPNTPDEPGRQP